MNSEEISKLFKLDQVDFEKCISSEEYESKLSKQADDFFFDNYFKNEEILFSAFDFYYSKNLLENNENLIKLKKLLNSNKIFGGVSKSMLKKSRLNFDKIEKCK